MTGFKRGGRPSRAGAPPNELPVSTSREFGGPDRLLSPDATSGVRDGPCGMASSACIRPARPNNCGAALKETQIGHLRAVEAGAYYHPVEREALSEPVETPATTVRVRGDLQAPRRRFAVSSRRAADAGNYSEVSSLIVGMSGFDSRAASFAWGVTRGIPSFFRFPTDRRPPCEKVTYSPRRRKAVSLEFPARCYSC